MPHDVRECPGRHWFLRAHPEADIVCEDDSRLEFVRGWLREKRPLIVRRPVYSEDGRYVEAGLALPGRSRLGVRVATEAVEEFFLPPLVKECASLREQNNTSAWEEVCQLCGEELRVFGSHAWQALTGLDYVTSTSDVDLVVFLRSSWERFLEFAGRAGSPRNIDLEIVLSSGAAFLWREFLQDTPRLLFKGNERVWLGTKADIPLLHSNKPS